MTHTFKPIDLWDPDLKVLAIGDSGLQNAALTQRDIEALDPNSTEKPKPLLALRYRTGTEESYVWPKRTPALYA